MSDNRKTIAKRAIGMVDLTDLTDNCTDTAIDDLCNRAQTAHGPTGAICIWPQFVAHAKSKLADTSILIATVVNFPNGNQRIDDTVAETVQALDDGADEIDLVLPYSELKQGNEAKARAMVVAVRSATSGRGRLKVIIESGELGSDALIRKASELSIAAGADFIKTSTGKVAENATLKTAEIMIQAIADSGKPVGFKPAGGIKTTEDCGDYLAIADRIMGAEWATGHTFRFGASGVLNDLLAAADGETATTTDGY